MSEVLCVLSIFQGIFEGIIFFKSHKDMKLMYFFSDLGADRSVTSSLFEVLN